MGPRERGQPSALGRRGSRNEAAEAAEGGKAVSIDGGHNRSDNNDSCHISSILAPNITYNSSSKNESKNQASRLKQWTANQKRKGL